MERDTREDGRPFLKRTVLFIVLSVCMMIGIFVFSSQTGSTSQGLSDSLTLIFAGIFDKDITAMGSVEQEQFAQSVSFPVRKAAHMGEYAILAILVGEACYSACCTTKEKLVKPKLQLFALAFAICVVYAASDEFHQTFVNARSGQIGDVGIDSIGILVGILITAGLCLRNYSKKGS